MEKGDIKKLNTACLGNPEGTKGVCYDVYSLGGRVGYSFIFPNGNYDGFSEDEVEMFFQDDYFGHNKAIEDYNFQNVIKLTEDFDKGKFDKAFNV